MRISHRVKEIDLEGGEHVYTWRPPLGAYAHHGYNLLLLRHLRGRRQSRTPHSSFQLEFFSSLEHHLRGVIISDLASFMGTGKLYRYEYGVSKLARIAYRSGTCTTRISDPAEDVIRRANYLVENEVFGKYNLFTNNCEDYAIYCKTEYVVGNPYEDYGRSGQASTAVGVPVYLIRSLSLAGFLHPLGILAVAALSHAVKKYNADIGVREDGVRVPVENLAGFRRYYHLREENNEILQGLIPGSAGIVLCSD